MKKRYTFLLLLLFPLLLFSQQKRFDIFVLGRKVGYLNFERVDKGNGLEHYNIHSFSKANLFFKTKIWDIHFDVFYLNDKMTYSYVQSVDEDSVTQTIQTILENNKYILKKGKEVKSFSELILCSTILLYLREPENIHRIYSERSGGFYDLDKVDEHEYEYDVSNNLRNFFRYRNGLLYEAELKQLLGSIYIRIKK